MHGIRAATRHRTVMLSTYAAYIISFFPVHQLCFYANSVLI